MTNTLPALFLSHGAPTLALHASPAHTFLQELGKALPRPKAILIASAHWESMGTPAVSVAPQPETIHDFGGFPQALYEMQYPAPGAPEVAERAAVLLEQAGITTARSVQRGLDHGAWVPLRLMYPDADIPAAQISVLRGATPTAHAAIGKTLASLRDEGVLIIGSGSLTHNLYELRGHDLDSAPPAWVSDFSAWMHDKLGKNDREALLAYREQAPSAERNHPTEEHLLPLFVALGAAGDAPTIERLHHSYEYGLLAMDMYAFA
jgi:4,5-DOPA dioxygenase extradiol